MKLSKTSSSATLVTVASVYTGLMLAVLILFVLMSTTELRAQADAVTVTAVTSSTATRSAPVAVTSASFDTPVTAPSRQATRSAISGQAAAPTSAAPDIVIGDHYVLDRPIARSDALVDYVDRTYPYGSTQQGLREVHTGVEFFNRRFTPVLAAASGRVVFAGTDDVTLAGPMLNYYGNLIIIEHDIVSPEGLPTFTLYGHLQTIDVRTGDDVLVGREVGQVGDSGIAIGPHLHFEVRVGDPFDFYMTRNPELWIRPYDGFGTLAGALSLEWATDRESMQDVVILARKVSNPQWRREATIYGSNRVNSDPAWNENFTLGDLPAELYEVIFTQRGRILKRVNIEIRDGATSFIELNLPETSP